MGGGVTRASEIPRRCKKKKEKRMNSPTEILVFQKKKRMPKKCYLVPLYRRTRRSRVFSGVTYVPTIRTRFAKRFSFRDWLRTKATYEAFYGSPHPQLFFNEIVGFETSSRPYLLKHGAPCHLDVIVR